MLNARPAAVRNAKPSSLEAGHILRLEPFRTFADFELDCLAFGERFVPFGLNRGVVDEDVLAGLPGDEAVAF